MDTIKNPKRSIGRLGVIAALHLFSSISGRSADPDIHDLTDAAIRAAVEAGGSYTFSQSGTIALANPLVVTGQTILDGSGQRLAISGGQSNRVFEIRPGASLTLI